MRPRSTKSSVGPIHPNDADGQSFPSKTVSDSHLQQLDRSVDVLVTSSAQIEDDLSAVLQSGTKLLQVCQSM